MADNRLDIDNALSVKCQNGAVLAAMMVVAIHAAGSVGRPLDSISNVSALWWLEALGHWGIFSVAVPFFFVCSGYFLAKHFGETGWWWRECNKRVNSLLVPYIVWCVIFMLLPIMASIAASLLYWRIAFQMPELNSRFWIQSFGLSPFCYPALPLLWYLRTVFLFVLLAPILRYLIKKSPLWFIAVVYFLAFMAVVGLWCSPNKLNEFFCYCFKLEGLFYFSLGCYLRMNNIVLTIRRARKYFLWQMLLGISLLLVSVMVTRWTGKNFMYLGSVAFAPPLLFVFWHLIPSKSFPKWLTGNTFAIFLIHGVVLKAVERGFHWHVLTIPQWIAKWTVAFSLSVFAAILLRRFSPCVSRILFGGR